MRDGVAGGTGARDGVASDAGGDADGHANGKATDGASTSASGDVRGRAEGPLRLRRGRLVFRARRPAALVLPLAVITETAGVLSLLNGATIGWFVCGAPLAALLVTGVVLRPTLELTREGLLQRQYPFSSLTRWEVIDDLGLTRAGNRLILAYRLRRGIAPPRRQPAAALLKAAGQPFDGGYFADAIAADPADVLDVVRSYLEDAGLRAALPTAAR